MNIEAQLEQIGLSKQEAKVYLACLTLGVAKASEIAQKAQIAREAGYYILKLLHEKGFISEVIKAGVKHYSAVPPKRILEIIDEEKEQQKETIKEVLPELLSLQKTAISRPRIEVYEGLEGFKNIASIILSYSNQELYCYVPENILKFLPTFHPQFRRKRKERNIRLKVITERKPLTLDLRKLDKKELRETRFNEEIIKNIEVFLYILPDAIAFLRANAKEQLGILIKDKGIAQLQKQIFFQNWKHSEKKT